MQAPRETSGINGCERNNPKLLRRMRKLEQTLNKSGKRLVVFLRYTNGVSDYIAKVGTWPIKLAPP